MFSASGSISPLIDSLRNFELLHRKETPMLGDSRCRSCFAPPNRAMTSWDAGAATPAVAPGLSATEGWVTRFDAVITSGPYPRFEADSGCQSCRYDGIATLAIDRIQTANPRVPPSSYDEPSGNSRQI